MLDNGDFQDAIEILRRATEIDPEGKDAYFSLGIALQKIGEVNAAIENYRKAIELDPQYAQAYYNLGVSFYETKNWKGAI